MHQRLLTHDVGEEAPVHCSRARVSSIFSFPPATPPAPISLAHLPPRIINKSVRVHDRLRGEDRDIEVVCVPRGYLSGQ